MSDRRPSVCPLWPCAATGAAACLAGMDDLTVILHGSSGCYYYPSALIPAPLHCTFLVEEDIIMGAYDRLREVVDACAGQSSRVAVVKTCVPAVTGEEIQEALGDRDVLVVDAPGFCGGLEEGHRRALAALAPVPDQSRHAVNLDGITIVDPHFRGDICEARRLLSLAGIPVGAVISQDSADSISSPAPYTVTIRPELASGTGIHSGNLLGLDEVERTFSNLPDLFPEADPDPVLRACQDARERLVKVSDKYLRRFDPPSVAVIAGEGTARFIAGTLAWFFDADITAIISRTPLTRPAPRAIYCTDAGRIQELIASDPPDLVVGSSYERTMAPEAAFVGVTIPLRDRVRLCARPLAGIEGTLALCEDAVNACIDREKRRRRGESP
ncbi:MAG: nitrogenase component 1 [Methanoculleaceae archaeon]